MHKVLMNEWDIPVTEEHVPANGWITHREYWWKLCTAPWWEGGPACPSGTPSTRLPHHERCALPPGRRRPRGQIPHVTGKTTVQVAVSEHHTSMFSAQQKKCYDMQHLVLSLPRPREGGANNMSPWSTESMQTQPWIYTYIYIYIYLFEMNY